MNTKPLSASPAIALGIVIVWLCARSSLAKISPIWSLVVDVALVWLCAPMLLHIFAIIFLAKGLDSSAATKSICFNLGLTIEKLAVGIDSLNRFIPGNVFYQGADDRKVTLGAFLHALEKRQEAKEYLTALYKELKAGGDNSTKSLSSCLNFLSEIANHEGDYKEAKKLSDESLELVEKSQEDPIGRSAILIDLCTTYLKQGQCKESINIGKKAVAGLENQIPPVHQLHGIAYNNLALAYAYAGDYENSLRCNEKALELKKLAAPAANFSWTASLSNISETLIFMERYDEALAKAQEALSILDQLGYKTDPRRATILQNVGSAQVGLGHFSEAKVSLDQSLKVKNKILPASDPEWCLLYLDLARLHAGLKENSAADNYFTRAIERGKHTLGEKHPRMAYLYLEHARYLENTDRRQEASTAREQAQEITERLN